MPMREIKKKYTKSDMAIMAWRSQEMSYNMRERSNTRLRSNDAPRPRNDDVDASLKRAFNTRGRGESSDFDSDIAALEERLGPVAKKLDENLDLRKLTGAEAHRYMRAMGLNVPIMRKGF